MIRKYVLPILAAFGLFMGIRTVFLSNQPPPVAPAVVEPPKIPYTFYVSGAGIVESSSENIAIAAPVGGLVTQVYVKVGSKVKVGDALFVIDDRSLKAEVVVRKSAIEVARTDRDDAKTQLALLKSLSDKRAVSEDEYSKRKFAAQRSEARLVQAEAELAAAQTDLDRLTVRAPIDGEILQVKTRAGEFAAAQNLATPLILMGKTDVLHLRVDVDENDAWRLVKDSHGSAYVRGNYGLSASVHFVRFEPYVLPKRSLTGDSTERVDTRVLQVIYSLDKVEFPLFVGQLMDVYIEAAPRS